MPRQCLIPLLNRRAICQIFFTSTISKFTREKRVNSDILYSTFRIKGILLNSWGQFIDILVSNQSNHYSFSFLQENSIKSFIHFTTSAVKSYLSCRLFDTSTALVLATIARLVAEGSWPVRKSRNNEKMKRKWRKIHTQHFLIFSLFPPSPSISYILYILSQNVKYGTSRMSQKT